MKCITTNMENNNFGKIINKSFIYMLALTIFICSAMLFLCNLEKNKVYADYNEVSNNPDAIVNFNQYYSGSQPIHIVSDTTTRTNKYIQNSFSTNNSDIWYFYSNAPAVVKFTIVLYNNGTYVTYYDYSGSYLFSASDVNYDSIIIQINTVGVCDGNYYFNFINISQMFGQNNEPNINQCREIFVTDYYNYSTGSPMSLNTFVGYNQALQDIFSSYKYQLSMNALTLSTYSIDYKNEESYFDYNNSNWYFFNTFAVPLFTTLNSGATITIDYRFYVYELSEAWFLNVMIYNGNEYITIYTSPEQVDTSREQNMSFTLPLDTDTLYFNIVYNNQIKTDANAIVYKFNVSANQLDINSMIYNSFLSGQKDMARQYQVGGERYNEIYRQGVADAESNGSVFDSSWAFVASAFSGIGELLSTELMPNVPIGLFVALPLLLGLIFFIVKLTKGGS